MLPSFLTERISAMLKTTALTTALLTLSGPVLAVPTNLITNGSFEEGQNPGQIFTTLPTNSAAITGWQVVSGTVDYPNTGLWQPSNGQRNIDMNGTSAGAISQSFPTAIGKQYQVLFDMAGNYGNRSQPIKIVRVSGGDYSQDFYFDITGHNSTNMGWTEKSLIFTATRKMTTLSFTSQITGSYGAVIDNVRVWPFEPQIVTLSQPDLAVIFINTADLFTDLQTLQVSGTVQVTLSNFGTATRPALVTLFEDTNHNRQFDYGVDHPLGTMTTPAGLVQEETLKLDIPVSGSVTFRDSPLYAFVDSDQRIGEANEANNLDSTANLCLVASEEVSFEPTLKWEWKGGYVLNAPVVAPLEDTNGDGKINELDVPSVLFNHNSVITAVNGKDGHLLWSIPDYPSTVYGYSNLAVADIDKDGFVEIIAPKSNAYGVKAFEHTGQLKWQSLVDPYMWAGGVSIADLDGDGSPEIIAGKVALHADGSLRWWGSGFTGDNGGGPLSVVADINLDGKPEVIAGAAAYSNTGQRLWQNTTVGDGFVGISNFNEDNYPEIVVVSSGRVFLLNYQGNILWGPVYIPYGGHGGAPTIADVDGDGRPEIGVAGAYHYMMLNHDGSLLWAVPTQDSSSQVTGSSVFDFNGDGEAEVVYADEQYLRIYRGKDGRVLAEVPNMSGTAYELPVIVDVDNDNHADIIVGGDNGIHVYQDKHNSWVNTRKIWNQHSYHVTNINDDGTVPVRELNSWQVHNTYRLNTLNITKTGASATSVPDLTASQLQLTYDGLSVRIGNGGAVRSPEGVKVRFYENHPVKGENQLGIVTLGSLEPGTYQDVVLNPVGKLSEGTTLYAFVDAGHQVSECNESNNTAWMSSGLDRTIQTFCKFYGVNDDNLNTSQFVIFDVDNNLVNPLGPRYQGYDIEAIAIHPQTHRIYAASGNDVGPGKLKGHLVVVDAHNGVLVSIGHTGFEEVNSLAFTREGTLYGWAKGKGLITLDTETGKGQVELASDIEVDDLTLSQAEGTVFYGVAAQTVWQYTQATGELKVVCDNLPGKKVEALTMLPENLLLFGIHGENQLHLLDLQNCQVTKNVLATQEFNDVEGLAFGGEACYAAYQLVEKVHPKPAPELPVTENDSSSETSEKTLPDPEINPLLVVGEAINPMFESSSLFFNPNFMARLNTGLSRASEKPIGPLMVNQLTIIIDDDFRVFWGRPDVPATPVSDLTLPLGITTLTTDDGGKSKVLVFKKDDGKLYQQPLSPLPFTKEEIRSFFDKEALEIFPDLNRCLGNNLSKTKEFVLKGDGTMLLTIDSKVDKGTLALNIMDPDPNLVIYREKENCQEDDERNCRELVKKRPFIQLIQDANGDAKGDLEIIYKDNAKQRLYVKELPSLKPGG